MALSDYLQTDRVLFLSATRRRDVLREMVDRVEELKLVPDRRAFETVVENRELIVSTGIGLGVAIPHAKLSGIDDFFVLVAVLKDEVDWDSIDKNGVRLVFLIGGPDGRQTEYLKILAKIVLVTKNEKLRGRLLAAGRPEEVVAPFADL